MLNDLVHYFTMLLLTLFIKAAHLGKCRFTVLLTRLPLCEIVAWLSVIIFLRWSRHGASPRTRHFFTLGIYFVKLIRKAKMVAKTNPKLHKDGK